MTYIYSKTLFIWLCEACIQKGLFWGLGFGNQPFLDLLAYSGYKFVVLCPISIAELLVGYLGSYIVLAVLGTTFAWFFY